MHTQHNSERGQVLIIVVLAIIGLIGITGLAIDGSLLLADRRRAQHAADSAALAGALERIHAIEAAMSEADVRASMRIVAWDRAEKNGYLHPVTSIVEVYTCDEEDLGAACPAPYTGDSDYLQVLLTSNVDTLFARILGISQLHNRVQAVALAKAANVSTAFDGAAVVALNPTLSSHGSYPCGFDSGNSNSAHWSLTGGGIFSNGCAHAKNTSSVSLDEDGEGDPTQCVTTVGSASNFKCMQANQGSSALYSMTDVAEIMPPMPACDNTPEGGYVVPSTPSSFTFENGVYCVTNFDAFTKKDIVLDNATLYVNDPVFDVKFAGDGGFAGSASTSGTYKGIFLLVAMNNDPCERYQDGPQSLEFRGNGTSDVIGTLMIPTVCLDFRGNSNGYQTRSQIVGYTVSSNGNASVSLDFTADDNYKLSFPPRISLVK